jgi:putative ABC transport system permease protein
MLKHLILSFIRSTARNRLYALLCTTGLALGIGVFLVLAIYVRFQSSFEQWLPHHHQVFLVQSEWRIPGNQPQLPGSQTSAMLLERLREAEPEIRGTRLYANPGNVLRNGVGYAEVLTLVDPQLLDVLALPMARGSAASLLADPANVIISETHARKYFPDSDPIGKSLVFAAGGAQNSYRVAAIMRDIPDNSDLELDMIARLPLTPPNPNWTSWGSGVVQTYLRIPDSMDQNQIEPRLADLLDRFAKNDLGSRPSSLLSLTLLPLADRHLAQPGARLSIVTLGLVGFLTLLMAIVNYANLATARAGLRAKEVVMRKVLGATPRLLIMQFLGEAIALALIAALLGLALVEFMLPPVNAAGGLALTIPYLLAVPLLLILAIVIGMLAGAFPALVLARLPMAQVLAAARTPGGGRKAARIRSALVLLQFVIAIALMTGTFVLLAQTNHVRNADLGFSRDRLVIVSSMWDTALSPLQRRQLTTAFRALPSVASVSLADTAVADSEVSNTTNLPIPGQPGAGPSLRFVTIGSDFFETYGMKFVAGRSFSRAFRLDDATLLQEQQSRNIIINETAASALGFRNSALAIGKVVGRTTPRTIVGVVADARFYSPRDPVQPTFYEYNADGPADAIASVRSRSNQETTIAELQKIWRQIAPQVAFEAKTADQNLMEFYRSDDQTAVLFTFGSALSIAIGCFGLWGLATFTIERRFKEIGIRKVLGASRRDIVLLLLWQFLKPVLLANLLAWPLAYLVLQRWLDGFSDRIALSPVYFIAATGITGMIAVATVLGKLLHASTTPPSWALRYE